MVAKYFLATYLKRFKTITAKHPERPIETTYNYSTYINYWKWYYERQNR